MTPTGRTGVVVMAYGTPATPGDIEAFYTHIRRGRPPTREALAELTARYAALGGTSPLAERTEAQRDRIAAALEAIAPGRFQVRLGNKHAPPFIEDAAAALAAAGIERTIGLVLAPHHSRRSVGEYQSRLAAACGAAGARHLGIDAWYDEPAYLDFLAAAVRDGLAGLPPGAKVLFSAHSLPEQALVDDPYPDQLRASAAAVAERVGLDRWAGWSLCWQSAGMTADRWQGPDVGAVLADLARTGRATGVLVCPQGFVADHLEVRYDLDVVAAGLAADLGLAFARTRVLNDDPEVLGALAARVARLDRTGWDSAQGTGS